ncbi:MAG: prepilin-type N-terminal cleavage/methylation domain-containing protein [Candidatus Omnitrophota bacterium]|nr:MAG: prepilin-type N-terminal cleavage/methylation domain-containing protein [Candidatus Omnitrophota bacterium]
MKIFITRHRGFTLVEIMIIAALIALLATITIPQMARSRVNANEVAAVGNMRTLYKACLGYYGANIPHTYPNALTDLTLPISDPPFISIPLANAITANTAMQGYYYVYTLGADNESFTIVAWPSSFGRTGAKNFFIMETGQLTYTATNAEEPDASSPPAPY